MPLYVFANREFGDRYDAAMELAHGGSVLVVDAITEAYQLLENDCLTLADIAAGLREVYQPAVVVSTEVPADKSYNFANWYWAVEGETCQFTKPGLALAHAEKVIASQK